ncbi:portal protein [Paraburkholderia caballeronis]|uniref:portal protein n=1 Tax=Paraburkholderia caballeronis TaxID=416943 RepID=UPI001065CC04|nr:portal protein [Paraburkholderia caballeronis]TDV06057.1 phage P22-like portal protein [Paraburkholderia caballeronis]TDV09597.1 phage P22-like portal protein [Paraburkholderia caballeronis]TDV21662.1 phage P22-like portal protein [Paraburkholderia caballeronis]
MMGKSKEEISAEVVERSCIHFDMSYKSQQEIRLKCLQDRRFVFVEGAMWEDALRLQFDNKPRFEVNKMHMAVVRIFNEYRANRASVRFLARDDDANSHTADNLAGMYRADEKHGGAQEAYDNAFEEGVAGGMGAWRLRNVEADEFDDEDDHQKIVFEPIYDADSSVFFSLDGKKYDKSDARRGWVISATGRDAYAEEWGDTGMKDPWAAANSGQPATFRKVQKMTEFDWYTPDVIYVAEYYEVEDIKTKVHVFRQIGKNEKDRKIPAEELTPEDREELQAMGYSEIRVRTKKKRRVHKWIHDGARVLEDCGYIAGPNIPIVPFYGKRAYIDNQERIMGHVRLGKDAQRLFNMQISLLAIVTALSPRRKPIFTPDQIRGHEMTWAEDNIKDNPYLLINPVVGPNGEEQAEGPVGYTDPPPVPQSLAALLELTDSSIKELLGNQQAGEQVPSNVSNELMQTVQTHVDMQAFIYMDNFGKSMLRSGQIWLGMAKEVYDEEGRRMVTVGPDGTEGEVRLKHRQMVDGVHTVMNDLQAGKYEADVDTGPGFKSRRDAMVAALVQLLPFMTDPQMQSLITSLIIANLEGEGLGDVREFMRMKLVQMGVVQPTDEEREKLEQQQKAAAQQPPSPQQQMMAAELAHKTAVTHKTNADTLKTLAGAANSRADAIARLADHGVDRLRFAHEVLQTLIAQTSGDAAQAGGASAP